MAKDLRVDPANLHQSAGHLDVTADDLRARHANAHGRISAARAGFIGASASALAARTAQWEEESASHYAEIAAHGENFRSAVALYIDSDAESGERVDAAASKFGTMGL